jgi:hypothetical protein
LEHGDARHHAKRQPIAPHLDELLDDNGPETRQIELKLFHARTPTWKMTKDE